MVMHSINKWKVLRMILRKEANSKTALKDVSSK